MLSMFKDKKGFSALFAAQAASARTVPVLHDRPARLSAQDSQQRSPVQVAEDVLSRTYRCQRCWRTFYVDETARRGDFVCECCDYPICMHCRSGLGDAGATVRWRCCSCAQAMTLMRLFDSTRYGTQLVIRVIEFCDARSERILKSFFHAAAQQLSVHINSPSSSSGRLSSPPPTSAAGRLSRRSTTLLQTLPPPPSLLQCVTDKENRQGDAATEARKTVAAPPMLDVGTGTGSVAAASDVPPRHEEEETVTERAEAGLRARSPSAHNQVVAGAKQCTKTSSGRFGTQQAELSYVQAAQCAVNQACAAVAATNMERHDNVAPVRDVCEDGDTVYHAAKGEAAEDDDDEELRVSASSGRTATSRSARSTSATPAPQPDGRGGTTTTATTVASFARQATAAFAPTAPTAERVSPVPASDAKATNGEPPACGTATEASTMREVSVGAASSVASSSRSASPAPRFPTFSQFLGEQAAAQTRPLLQLQQQQQQREVVTAARLPGRHGGSNSGGGGGGSHEAGLVTVSPESSSEGRVELNSRRYSGRVAVQANSTTPASSKKNTVNGSSTPQALPRTPREASSSKRTRHTNRLTTAHRRSESRLTPVAAAYMLSARRLSGARTTANSSASATPQAQRQRSGVRLSFGEVSAVAEEGLTRASGQGSLLRVSAPRQEGSRRRTGLGSARTTATTPPITPSGKPSSGSGADGAVRPVRAVLARTVPTTTTATTATTRMGHRATAGAPTATAVALTRTASRMGNVHASTRLARTPSSHGGAYNKTGMNATTPGRLARTPSSTAMRRPILLHPFGGRGRAPATTTPRSPPLHSARSPLATPAVGPVSGAATPSSTSRVGARVPALPLSPHSAAASATPPSSSLTGPATHRSIASATTPHRGGLLSQLFLARTPSTAAPAVLTRMRSGYAHAGPLYTRTATATPSSLLLLRRTRSANAALFGRCHTEVPASLRLARTRSLNTPLTRPPRYAGAAMTTPRTATTPGQRAATRPYTRTNSLAQHPPRAGVTAAPCLAGTASATAAVRTPARSYGGGDTFASRAHVNRPPPTASPLKRLHTAAALNGEPSMPRHATPTTLRRVPTSRAYERVPSNSAATGRRAELAPTAQRAARTAAAPSATGEPRMVVYMTRTRHATPGGTLGVGPVSNTGMPTIRSTAAAALPRQQRAGTAEMEGVATATTMTTTDGTRSESDGSGGGTTRPAPPSSSGAVLERGAKRSTPRLAVSGRQGVSHTAEARFAGPAMRVAPLTRLHVSPTTTGAGLQHQVSSYTPLVQRFARTDR